MKANTTNQAAVLSLVLLFLASFQSSNALSPSLSKNSTALKAESVATSDLDGATSRSPSKRESSASRPVRVTPAKTSSPVNSSPPVKTFPSATASSASADPLVKDFPPAKTPSPTKTSSPVISSPGGGTKCTACRKCSGPQRTKPVGRRLSRFMLQSLQRRHLHFNPHCQRCDGDDNACQRIGDSTCC